MSTGQTVTFAEIARQNPLWMTGPYHCQECGTELSVCRMYRVGVKSLCPACMGVVKCTTT